MPREWNARSYDALPLPHARWGARVLDGLAAHGFRGASRLLDAGCGTGRDAAAGVGRWPSVHMVLIDGSANMLDQARDRLGDRAEYVRADLLQPIPVEPVDAVMSVAAFHWVHDHRVLFKNLSDVMRPGAPLVSECGGAGNVAGVDLALARVAGAQTPAHWHFAGVEETAAHLEASGFEVQDIRLRPDPFRCPDPDMLADYLEVVVLGSHLARIPQDQRQSFVREVQRALPAPEIDYVRLEIDAVRR